MRTKSVGTTVLASIPNLHAWLVSIFFTALYNNLIGIYTLIVPSSSPEAIVFSERLIRRLIGHLQDIHQYIYLRFPGFPLIKYRHEISFLSAEDKILMSWKITCVHCLTGQLLVQSQH